MKGARMLIRVANNISKFPSREFHCVLHWLKWLNWFLISCGVFVTSKLKICDCLYNCTWGVTVRVCADEAVYVEIASFTFFWLCKPLATALLVEQVVGQMHFSVASFPGLHPSVC